MSLFDPTPHEWAELNVYGYFSDEPLPELPPSSKTELDLELHRISVKIARSPERNDGWEDAYNAFAECLEKHGARLTPRQTQLDLPNMLFNFALNNSWFPDLLPLSKTGETPDITAPIRRNDFCVKSDHRGVTMKSKMQCLDWYKDRIRPAVLEWTLKATEREIKSAAFRKELLKLAAREVMPKPDADVKAELAGSREAMVEDYKHRLLKPDGKKYSRQALYTARQHSMHKPQFYEWIDGDLAPSHPASQSFERFLKGKAHPIARTAKEK